MNKKRQTGPVDYSSVDFDKLMASLGDVSYLIGDHIKETLTTLFEGFKRGVTPKQALNISPQSVEQLYTQAYTLYNQGNYKKAIILFQVLMLIDPGAARHVMGCAASLHRMQQYEKAAQIYLLCSALAPENPLPHFHAADCYMQIKALDLAAFSLKNAIACAKEQSEFIIIKERAQMMLNTVEEAIKARNEETLPESQDSSRQEPIS